MEVSELWGSDLRPPEELSLLRSPQELDRACPTRLVQHCLQALTKARLHQVYLGFVPGCLAHSVSGYGRSQDSILFIQWAAHGIGAAVKHLCVDHSGFDILVTEKFLNSADIIAGLKFLLGAW